MGMGSALHPEEWGPLCGGLRACGAVATKEYIAAASHQGFACS